MTVQECYERQDLTSLCLATFTDERPVPISLKPDEALILQTTIDEQSLKLEREIAALKQNIVWLWGEAPKNQRPYIERHVIQRVYAEAGFTHPPPR